MDRDFLAEIFAEVVAEEFDGCLLRAVEATNRRAKERARKGKSWGVATVDYATAHRLVKKKLGSVTWPTYEWARLLVGRTKAGRLVAAVLMPQAHSALEEHEQWVKRETAKIKADGFDQTRQPIRAALAERQRSPRLTSLLSDMRKRVPHAFTHFEKCSEGHYPDRIELALYQIAAPFLNAGIERSWQELPEVEARKYVETALRQQEILLHRSPDVQRAQGLFARSRRGVRFATPSEPKPERTRVPQSAGRKMTPGRSRRLPVPIALAT